MKEASLPSDTQAERPVRFQAGGLWLEGRLHVPSARTPAAGLVICHPHPLYGGDMGNNVVDAVCRALWRADLATLRFNFRGVGGSQGQFDDGRGEQDDARAALACLAGQNGVDPQRLGLAGYSFGAVIALQVSASDPPSNTMIGALCAISPPTNARLLEAGRWGPQPKLIAVGDADPYANLLDLERWAAGLTPPADLRSFEEVDHFWLGAEEELGSIVAGFFARCLVGAPPAGPPHSQSSR